VLGVLELCCSLGVLRASSLASDKQSSDSGGLDKLYAGPDGDSDGDTDGDTDGDADGDAGGS
jgi:hypothetical protein